MTVHSHRQSWRHASTNPSDADLGYDPIELDVLSTETERGDRVLVLPTDEGMLRDDAFLIATPDSVVDPATRR